jgi:aryl-alcohol dehydrogenase-like predicted oxidoreductase
VKQRRLGSTGIEVGAIGLGCMGMSMWLGERDDEESAKVLLEALDLGVSHFDTADAYGPYRNEELLGRVIKGRRSEAFLATKFGFIFNDKAERTGFDGSPAHMRESIEGSLRRLQTDHVDLYYMHRVDPNVPVEESVGAMAELVAEGKVRFLGLSEPSVDSIRRAHAVHPIAAVENEYSLWSRGAEDALAVLRERGISMVAYSPLGRGFLTGTIKSTDDLVATDVRRTRFPRFDAENLKRNWIWLHELQELAARKGCTLPQLALAWVLAKGDDILTIPGTKRRTYLRENVAAGEVSLDATEVALLEGIVRDEVVAGMQKDEAGMKAMGH